MRFAFTGTRAGLTGVQAAALANVLQRVKRRGYTTMCNGAAHGADEQAAALGAKLFLVYAYPAAPPHEPSAQVLELAAQVYPPASPLQRNGHMVAASTLLVACPKHMHEELRSGTWATVRHARKLRRLIYIIWPDGSVTEEGVVG